MCWFFWLQLLDRLDRVGIFKTQVQEKRNSISTWKFNGGRSEGLKQATAWSFIQ